MNIFKCYIAYIFTKTKECGDSFNMNKGILFSFYELLNFSEARRFLLIKHLYLSKIRLCVSKEDIISSQFNVFTYNVQLGKIKNTYIFSKRSCRSFSQKKYWLFKYFTIFYKVKLKLHTL